MYGKRIIYYAKCCKTNGIKIQEGKKKKKKIYNCSNKTKECLKYKDLTSEIG